MSGPLTGVKIVEFLGMGPVPLCARLLSDMGADILQIRRAGSEPERADVLNHGRPFIALDLKSDEGREKALGLISEANVLLEGHRPGVMERLGLGPEECMAQNPSLIYARMTGWGQEGPLAKVPGHDINYIALTGALHAIGLDGGAPVPPLNLVGDFGGGSLYLAMGILAALLEAKTSGQGQVVDCAMVDGAASLLTSTYGFLAHGYWHDTRGTNFLDSGAPFYNTYQCADEGHLAVGAIEPQFYACLMEKTGLTRNCPYEQWDVASWPAMKKLFAELFITKTRDEWCALLEGTDACVSPVLSLSEAPNHPHMAARKTFLSGHNDTADPAPAPRFSRTVSERATNPRTQWDIETTDKLLA